MSYSPYLFAALSFGAVAIACNGLPAQASPHPLRSQPRTMADFLATERHSPDSLNRLADEMSQRVGNSSSGPNDLQATMDALGIPFITDLVSGLLDESGNVSLPLGLTVYDAMGTTSVGFGTSF